MVRVQGWVCVCLYNIGKKVLKLQFSDNKDIGLTFIYEITSSCISASSFAVLDIIFSAPLSNNMNVVKPVSSCTWTCILQLFQIQSCQQNIIYILCVFENLQIIFFNYLGTANFGSFLQHSHHRTPLTCFTFVLHIRHAT